jgi:stage III sporulation protein AH
MKINRQKIWFLSMFTLMIALSAYYLLSEEVKPIDAPPNPVNSETSEVTQVTDEQVLEQLQTEEDFFAQMNLKQQDDLALETEKYMKIITNPDSSTQAISTAMTAMQQLEDRSEKLTNLKEKIQQHFADAVIQQEQEQWKVVVQSDTLKRDQAVQIVQMVTEHLKVSPEQVTVQYRK